MTPRAPNRVQSIDGLRGVAAFIVVLFHLHGAVSRTATGWLWAPLDWIAVNGFLGVDIFFVISGFVIALSVSRGAPTFRYFGRFILRRSVRLDPPYWTAIALELFLIFLTFRYFPGYKVEFPSLPQLLAHLAYLQVLLGYGSIIDIFWTLCYEVQFYAFLVGLVVIHAKLPARLRATALVWSAFAVLYVFSLWTRYWRPAWLPSGLAIDRWFQFFIGVLTWWALTQPGRMRPLLAAWVALAVAVLAAGAPVVQLLAIPVSVLILLGVRGHPSAKFLSARPVLFLGMISYSLYLYHSSVGWRFVSLAQKLMPGPWTAPTAISVFVGGILVSVLISTLLWWFVERPFLSFSRRIRLPLRTLLPTTETAP